MTVKNQKSSKAVAITAPITAPVVTGTGIGSTTAGSGLGGVTLLGAIASAPKGFRLSVQQMLQGVQTVLPAGSSLPAASGAVSQATMVSQMQAVLQAYQAVSDGEVQLQETRGTFSAQLSTFHQQYTVLKNLLIGYFGAGSPQLAKFGLKPRAKARTLTPEQQVARKVRSKATRELRGTLGSREKQAVVFNGTVSVSATPVPAAGAATGSATTPAAVPAASVAPAAAPVVPAVVTPGSPPGSQSA